MVTSRAVGGTVGGLKRKAKMCRNLHGLMTFLSHHGKVRGSRHFIRCLLLAVGDGKMGQAVVVPTADTVSSELFVGVMLERLLLE